MRRITAGEASSTDLDLLNDLASHIPGRSLCLLGDSVAAPVMSALRHFRGDFEAHIATGRCPSGCIPF
jgi:NADH:ubiquinone oxidoreductase subunit F (NADH-binding)